MSIVMFQSLFIPDGDSSGIKFTRLTSLNGCKLSLPYVVKFTEAFSQCPRALDTFDCSNSHLNPHALVDLSSMIN